MNSKIPDKNKEPEARIKATFFMCSIKIFDLDAVIASWLVEAEDEASSREAQIIAYLKKACLGNVHGIMHYLIEKAVCKIEIRKVIHYAQFGT